MKNPAPNMKIQKLLYLAWIEYYSKTGKWLFDNPIHAWKFGPVVESVHFEYRMFAAMPIYFNNHEPPRFSKHMEEFLGDFAERHPERVPPESYLYKGIPWKRNYVKGRMKKVIPFEQIIEYQCKGGDPCRSGRE